MKENFKEFVEEVIQDEIGNGELEINQDYKIEYTQSWLNKWLCGWIKDGYTTKEVMQVLDTFEHYEYETQATSSIVTGIHTYWNGNQEYITEEETYDVWVSTKKIA